MYSAEELMRRCGINKLKLKIDLYDMGTKERSRIGIDQSIDNGVLKFEGVDAFRLLYDVIENNIRPNKLVNENGIGSVFYTSKNQDGRTVLNVDETCTKAFFDIERLDLNEYIDPDMPPEILSLGIVKDGKVVCGLNSIFPMLAQVTVPDSVKIIDRYSFKSLSCYDVILPDGLECIEFRSFPDSIIRTINIPSTVSHIGAEAFDNCQQLTSFDMSGVSQIEIGNRAFNGCKRIEQLILPAASSIGDSAFNGWGGKQIIVRPSKPSWYVTHDGPNWTHGCYATCMNAEQYEEYMNENKQKKEEV